MHVCTYTHNNNKINGDDDNDYGDDYDDEMMMINSALMSLFFSPSFGCEIFHTGSCILTICSQLLELY